MRAQGTMFDSLLRLQYSKPFHFDAKDERPPWRPRMSFYKDPNGVLHCHVLGTCAAAFLFLNGSAVCLLSVCEGEKGFHPP